MQVGNTTHGSQGKWQLYPEFKNVVFYFCMGKTAVFSGSRGISMHASFNGAKIVTSGHHYRVYPVHNALVVGYGPVWLNLRYADGPAELLSKLFIANTRSFIDITDLTTHFCSYQAFRCIIAQNAHNHLNLAFGHVDVFSLF